MTDINFKDVYTTDVLIKLDTTDTEINKIVLSSEVYAQIEAALGYIK